MLVHIWCEYSATIREEFAQRGHDAWSVDLLPSEVDGQHLQMDIRDVDYTGVDLLICHIECTNIANSGVRWLYNPDKTLNLERWIAMERDARLFKWVLGLPVPRICVENPIPHRYALEIIGMNYTQIIHPWQFGHGERKPTCLWLKGLPKLKPTNIVEGREQRIWKMAPSPTRGLERARTYRGIAEAMVDQWGSLND